MNRSPQTIKEAVNGPKIHNEKLFIKHENSIEKNCEQKTVNDYLYNDNHWNTGSWLRTCTLSMWRG